MNVNDEALFGARTYRVTLLVGCGLAACMLTAIRQARTHAAQPYGSERQRTCSVAVNISTPS
jgi:hypothetical protein